MQVKSVGRRYLLLLLSAAEAQLLGIPTEGHCAILLRRSRSAFSPGFPRGRCCDVQTQWQVYACADCTALFSLLEQLERQGFPHPVRLYRRNADYLVAFRPNCRQLFHWRSLAGEFAVLIGVGNVALAQVQERGVLLSLDAIAEIGTKLHRA